MLVVVTISRVVDDQALLAFVRVIVSGDGTVAANLLDATPELARAALATAGATRARAEEFFLYEDAVYLYAGHTALHVAAAAYDTAFARTLVSAGAIVRAKNRRGAEPLHEATRGGPGSSSWNPARQATVIAYAKRESQSTHVPTQARKPTNVRAVSCAWEKLHGQCFRGHR